MTGPRSWPEPEMDHGLQLSSTHINSSYDFFFFSLILYLIFLWNHVSVCLFFRFLSTFCPDLSVVWRNPVLLAKKRTREDASAS